METKIRQTCSIKKSKIIFFSSSTYYYIPYICVACVSGSENVCLQLFCNNSGRDDMLSVFSSLSFSLPHLWEGGRAMKMGETGLNEEGRGKKGVFKNGGLYKKC